MKVKVLKYFYAIKEKKYFDKGDILTNKDATLQRLKVFVSNGFAEEIKEAKDEKSR